MVAGSNIFTFRMNEETALDILPPRVYTVKYNQIQGFFLEITKDKLELPAKIYGKAQDRVDKCISTYQDRSASTGILFTGDKGTGKTLEMSLLANDVIDKLHLAIILVTEPYNGEAFVSFIETLGECCLVFDEFGKMYSSDSRKDNDVPQKSLLSLMDGVDKTKRMIILTENKELDINEFMLNRPSRIYYHFRYKKLDEDSIIGYCRDAVMDSNTIRDIIDLSRRSKIFSFDMLQSIVEEQLRFNDTIENVVEELNIDTREDSKAMIEILKVVEKGSQIEREVFGSKTIPVPDHYSYIKLVPGGVDDVDDDEFVEDVPELGLVSDGGKYDEFHIQISDLAYEEKGKLVYETDRFTVIAKELPVSRVNYFNMF